MNIKGEYFLIIGLLGLCFGSFSTVLVSRIPKGESIIYPNSRCSICKSQIKWRHLIPLFSYFFLHGKSACCKTKISWIYPAIEFCTAVLFILSLSVAEIQIKLLNLLAFSVLSIPLTVIDLKVKRLPNSLTFTGISFASIFTIFAFVENHNFLILISFVLNTLIPGFFFLILNVASKGGMGMGDVKLAAMIGASLSVFGTKTIFVSFVFAFILGALASLILISMKVASRKTLIPFGPYMILGAWISILIGRDNVELIANLWLVSS